MLQNPCLALQLLIPVSSSAIYGPEHQTLRIFCWSKSPYFCCTALSPFLGLVKYSTIIYTSTYKNIIVYIYIHVHTYNTYIYKLNMISHLLSSTPPSKDCEIVTWVHCLGGEHKWWMFKSTMVIYGYLWLPMAGLIEYGWTVELFFDDAGWFWRTWDHVDYIYIYINYHILLWFSAWSPIVGLRDGSKSTEPGPKNHP